MIEKKLHVAGVKGLPLPSKIKDIALKWGIIRPSNYAENPSTAPLLAPCFAVLIALLIPSPSQAERPSRCFYSRGQMVCDYPTYQGNRPVRGRLLPRRW